MLERQFAYPVKLDPHQAAGTDCSVCEAHCKFNRWTETLTFHMFSKRPNFSSIFPSKIFLLCNLILISKLDALVPRERGREREWGFNSVEESLQEDIRPGHTDICLIAMCYHQPGCFLGRHRLSVEAETKLCCLTGCPHFHSHQRLLLLGFTCL